MSEAAVKIIDNLPTAPLAMSAITPMAMLERAVASGAGMDMIDSLMGFQERWDKTRARKEFDAAISAAKAKIKPISRNATGHNSKRYADFAAIAGAVDPILAEHGLSYRFRTSQAGQISVTCILSHRDGHSEETTLTGPADQTGNKNAIQAIGSTLTYLQRYSLVSMLGLAAADDDDGKAAGAGEALTEEQLAKIQARIVEVGVDIAMFCRVMKIDKVENLPAKDYEAALRNIRDVENYNATQARKAKP